MQQHFSMAKEQGRQRVWETEKRRRTIFCSNSFRFAINVRLFTADEQTVNRWKTPATNPIFRPYFSNSLFFSSVLWLFLSNAASSSASHNIFANVIVRFQCYLLRILSKNSWRQNVILTCIRYDAVHSSSYVKICIHTRKRSFSSIQSHWRKYAFNFS